MYNPSIETIKSRFEILLNYNLEKAVENLKFIIHETPVSKSVIYKYAGFSPASFRILLDDKGNRLGRIVILFRLCLSLNINPFDLEKEQQMAVTDELIKLHSCFINRYFSPTGNQAKVIYRNMFNFAGIKKHWLEDYLNSLSSSFNLRNVAQMTYTDFFVVSYVLGFATDLKATLNMLELAGIPAETIATIAPPTEDKYSELLSPRNHYKVFDYEGLSEEEISHELSSNPSLLNDKILSGLINPGVVKDVLGVPCITKYVPYEWKDRVTELIKRIDPKLSRRVEDEDIGLTFNESMHFTRTNVWRSPLEVYICDLEYDGEKGEFIGYISEEGDKYLIRKSLHSEESALVDKVNIQIKGRLIFIQRDSED